MKTYQAVIVDDEPPAREVVAEYLEDVDWISVSGSFGNPRKALTFLEENQTDLLFLDIQMPQMSGFDLVDQLDTLPHIVFSTAYDEYAIRAFDINAVDYLLKPYTQKRFLEALQRVRQIAGDENQQKRIRALLQQVKEQEDYPKQLFVRSRDRIVPVFVDDILWIEAEGDYARIHLEDETVFCGIGLGKLMARVDPEHFVRVHRSHAIAFSALKNLEPDGYGGFTATLFDNTEVKVSRHYAERIKNFII
ncbi:DNA-binding response regulator [Aliifodinibius salipaludis]|uniref:DNA-binding response regulator n=1 Tax=Fodinibius salipaludis TaxID=2032627 RepID=A0A2A2G954_9BACT|nr:LytTR family DNA-binding domain-containing protein [Aliifodinibius salipaludis]PAU93690.1 DNA-binding response regulator [Aliifodinibius salipaludis]